MAAMRPLAVRRAHQALRNDGFQIAGQIHQQLSAACVREEIDDAVERLAGAVGMQSTQAQVPGLRECDRKLHGFGVADFPDQNDIGSLAKCIFERADAR